MKLPGALHRTTLLAVTLALGVSAADAAERLLGSYTARISPEDLRSEDGFHLKTPGQVIRQDRANVHKGRFIDKEDQLDPFYDKRSSRERLERMLDQQGGIDLRTREAIKRGDAVIKVQVYRNKVGIKLMY